MHGTIQKSFAVASDALPRRTAYSSLSAGWTLYDPAALALHLGISVDAANEALTVCGFNKATRVREELIKWKERLRHEETALAKEAQRLRAQLRSIADRKSRVDEQLQNIRNILRLPREPGEASAVIDDRSAANATEVAR
jgi:hypothetical protein